MLNDKRSEAKTQASLRDAAKIEELEQKVAAAVNDAARIRQLEEDVISAEQREFALKIELAESKKKVEGLNIELGESKQKIEELSAWQFNMQMTASEANSLIGSSNFDDAAVVVRASSYNGHKERADMYQNLHRCWVGLFFICVAFALYGRRQTTHIKMRQTGVISEASPKSFPKLKSVSKIFGSIFQSTQNFHFAVFHHLGCVTGRSPWAGDAVCPEGRRTTIKTKFQTGATSDISPKPFPKFKSV